MRHSYSIEEFSEAVKTSYSIAQALTKLGLSPKGGNYRVFKKFQKSYQIDTSHFTGKGHLKGKTHNYNTIPLEQILVKDFEYSSNKLRKRLISEGIKDHKCECCGLTEWLEEPIPLELDHVDGDHYNNTIENLKILCPNCHAKTPTYRGRNKKCKKDDNQQNNKKEVKAEHKCSSCGIELNKKCKTGLCKVCYKISIRKVVRPSKEELLRDLENSSYCAVGRKYNVTDNTIRKWVRHYSPQETP